MRLARGAVYLYLPGAFQADPADRMIAATCLHFGVPLVSADRLVRDWGRIRVIW